MADPATATIAIALAAIKAGAAIATWYETWRSNTNQGGNEQQGQRFYREMPNDVLYVLAMLGQRLLFLEVIDPAALPVARNTVREAFRTSDECDDLGEDFDDASLEVQYAVSCAMVFCAECWPMHMWRGFGCGIFNHMAWADPDDCSMFCMDADNAIAMLKSMPREWTLLTKSPARISHTEPDTAQYDKSVSKLVKRYTKDLVTNFQKHGFPQPLAPFDYIKITDWQIPFATFSGNVMYTTVGHSVDEISTFQLDPGRFLWAWTAGGRANLRKGEALILPSEPIEALAVWLEDLHGMKFRVIKDTQVDMSKIKLGWKTRRVLRKQIGNENGITDSAFIIVHDPRNEEESVQQISQRFSKIDLDAKATMQISPPTSPALTNVSSLSGDTLAVKPVVSNQITPVRRRPVPLPPPKTLRKVIAQHDFVPESEEELSFAAGDALEIIDDASDDGWWKARINGKVGMIPSTFVA